MDEDVAEASGRTALAWSRTLLGLAAVVGLIGVNVALVHESAYYVALLLGVSGVLLLTNTAATRRIWTRAAADFRAGARVVNPVGTLVLAAVTTALALAALVVLALSSPTA